MYYTIKKIKKKKDLLIRNIESSLVETSSMTFPDFLIIGAQKGGTTWLYETLRNLDGVFFPTLTGKHDPSEVRYFDERLFYPLTWYSNLYKGHENEIKGDKTPKYYLLSKPQIKFIYSLIPHVNIIFILRNPVERAWSQAIMNLKKFHQKDVRTDKASYIKFLTANLPMGYYSQYIKNWLAIFPSEQFKILLYDDLKKDPYSFLQDVACFLKLKLKEPIYIDVNKKVNENPKMEMPNDIHNMLLKEFQDEIIFLKKTFNLDVSHWLEA